MDRNGVLRLLQITPRKFFAPTGVVARGDLRAIAAYLRRFASFVDAGAADLDQGAVGKRQSDAALTLGPFEPVALVTAPRSLFRGASGEMGTRPASAREAGAFGESTDRALIREHLVS